MFIRTETLYSTQNFNCDKYDINKSHTSVVTTSSFELFTKQGLKKYI